MTHPFYSSRLSPADNAYLQLAHHVLETGSVKTDRTGTGTRSLFGTQFKVNVETYLPILTTKKLPLKSVIAELVWFLSGSANNNDLRALGSTIWDEWSQPNGELGPIYGSQWRNWVGYEKDHDQIATLIETLKTNPDSRRMLVSAWNVSDLEEMALQPCHFAFQINHDNGFLDLQWYQRSVDTFLGGPFNIASYGILLHMIAYHVGMKPRNLIGSFGDTHLYSNHLDAIRLQLTRSPNLPPRWQPKYDAAKPIWDVTVDELLESIYGYNPHPAIKAAVAV